MKSSIIVLLIGIFILGLLVGIGISKIEFGVTGKAIENVGNYTYTRAICSADNRCIDVFVSCSEGKAIEIRPVSELRDFGGEEINISDGEFC